ncbi:unnamed protein product [Arctogadus glacialis]
MRATKLLLAVWLRSVQPNNIHQRLKRVQALSLQRVDFKKVEKVVSTLICPNMQLHFFFKPEKPIDLHRELLTRWCPESSNTRQHYWST